MLEDISVRGGLWRWGGWKSSRAAGRRLPAVVRWIVRGFSPVLLAAVV